MATATACSVPLRDLLQQVGVCEVLQWKKMSAGKEVRKRGGGGETNARGRDRGHEGNRTQGEKEGMKQAEEKWKRNCRNEEAVEDVRGHTCSIKLVMGEDETQAEQG